MKDTKGMSKKEVKDELNKRGYDLSENDINTDWIMKLFKIYSHEDQGYKIDYIKNYFEGREEAVSNIQIIDKGETILIEDYDDEFIEVKKNKVKVMIYGSFILDSYSVRFIDVTEGNEKYKIIGIPLGIGVNGFHKARTYARKGTKVLGFKWLEDGLLLSYLATDKRYWVD